MLTLIDFSLILATIITSLTNFMKLSPSSDADMIDVMGGGDVWEEQQDDMTIEQQEARDRAQCSKASKKALGEHEGDGEPVPESWEDTSPRAKTNPEAVLELETQAESGEELLNVLKAFQILKDRFDEKFKKIWA